MIPSTFADNQAYTHVAFGLYIFLRGNFLLLRMLSVCPLNRILYVMFPVSSKKFHDILDKILHVAVWTGLEPSMRCPCCKVAVHETAFNRIEKMTTFVVGETVLRWDLATAATEKRSTPAAARVEVRPDESFTTSSNIEQ